MPPLIPQGQNEVPHAKRFYPRFPKAKCFEVKNQTESIINFLCPLTFDYFYYIAIRKPMIDRVITLVGTYNDPWDTMNVGRLLDRMED